MRKITVTSAKVESFLTTHALNTASIFLYMIFNVLLFVWGAHDQFVLSKSKFPTRSIIFTWYISIARGSGSTINFNIGMILIFASRKIHTWLRRTPIHPFLPLDKVLPLAHVIIGWFILGGTFIHIVAHCLWMFQLDEIRLLPTWKLISAVFLGIAAAIVFAAIFSLSLPSVREKNYRLFIRSHYAGGIIFIVLLTLHGMHDGKPSTYKWILPGVIIFIIDRAIVQFQAKSCKLYLSRDNVSIKPGDVIKIRIRRPFEFRAGQYAQICIPDISNQWNPFTIASAPHETDMVFYIKKMRGWTKLLFELFSSTMDASDTVPLQAIVRGPFGAPTQHVYCYDRVVLISGGIGATPHLSIVKDIYHRVSIAFKENESESARSEEDLNSNLYSQRLSEIVDQFYNMNPRGGIISDNEKEMNSRMLYIRMTLQHLASSPNSSKDILSRSAKECENADIGFMPATYEVQKYYSFFRTLGRRRARTLFFLHTTRVAFIQLLSLIVRQSFVCIAAIWRLAEYGWFMTLLKPSAFWVQASDTLLGVELSIFLMLTTSLELWLLGWKFFDRKRRWINLTILPLSILYDVFNVKSWRSKEVRGSFTITHFAFFLPLLFITFSYRLYRSVSSNNMLESGPRRSSFHPEEIVPGVDFIWTTRTSSDDLWLREDLEALQKHSKLRLNRFVTKQREVSDADENIGTYKGRPEIEKLFSAVSESTCSGTDVGVFFCGPSSMGSYVRIVAREVEIRSNLRGAFLSSLSDTELATTVGLKETEDIGKLRKIGCNVRFVYREENFGSQ